MKILGDREEHCPQTQNSLLFWRSLCSGPWKAWEAVADVGSRGPWSKIFSWAPRPYTSTEPLSLNSAAQYYVLTPSQTPNYPPHLCTIIPHPQNTSATPHQLCTISPISNTFNILLSFKGSSFTVRAHSHRPHPKSMTKHSHYHNTP